jgi:acyl-CoA synthetase (AMP-forming)/AMP-acid ligase II
MFTVFSFFAGVAAGAAARPFICIPPRADRTYLPDGADITYGEVLARTLELQRDYARAGYGHGHRVALLLENRPEFYFHFFALNGLGASIVPINPDYRLPELAYLFEHCTPDLVVGLAHRLADLRQVAAAQPKPTPVIDAQSWSLPPAPAEPPPGTGLPGDETETALLYTSGTTGRPKGCILTNRSMMATARFYSGGGGVNTFTLGQDRLLNPLPLYHLAGLCLTSLGMMIGGNCVIVLDRFQPSRLWQDAIATRATVLHYLGVVPAMLLQQPETAEERQHQIQFGLGGGAHPSLMQRFRDRFGFTLVEGWGMTEVGRSIFNAYEPRYPGRYAIGRPRNGLEARVVDEEDREVRPSEVGELCVRWGGSEGPRWGFFAGYLNDAKATEDAWRGEWWHTGDAVSAEADGTLFFVDRKKNIVRRSGENIAAAEVEMVLTAHPEVAQVAIVAAPDELRDEEVLACIVPAAGSSADAAAARRIFDHCNAQLAYYKAPGWILFMFKLPMTGTQKISKPRIFEPGQDPRKSPDIHDLREFKRRDGPVSTRKVE